MRNKSSGLSNRNAGTPPNAARRAPITPWLDDYDAALIAAARAVEK